MEKKEKTPIRRITVKHFYRLKKEFVPSQNSIKLHSGITGTLALVYDIGTGLFSLGISEIHSLDFGTGIRKRGYITALTRANKYLDQEINKERVASDTCISYNENGSNFVKVFIFSGEYIKHESIKTDLINWLQFKHKIPAKILLTLARILYQDVNSCEATAQDNWVGRAFFNSTKKWLSKLELHTEFLKHGVDGGLPDHLFQATQIARIPETVPTL